MEIKAFHHVCIQTTDYTASLHFYTQLLGFELVKETANFHTRAYNTWLKGYGMMIELQTAKQGTVLKDWHKLNAGPVHLCFLVEDVEAAYLFLQQKNYTNFKKKDGKEIYAVKGSPLFKVKAPEGTEIEIRNLDIE